MLHLLCKFSFSSFPLPQYVITTLKRKRSNSQFHREDLLEGYAISSQDVLSTIFTAVDDLHQPTTIPIQDFWRSHSSSVDIWCWRCCWLIKIQLLIGGPWSSSPTPYLGHHPIYGRAFGLIHLLANSKVWSQIMPAKKAELQQWTDVALSFWVPNLSPILWAETQDGWFWITIPSLTMKTFRTCNQSKTAHGSMERVSGVPLYKATRSGNKIISILHCLYPASNCERTQHSLRSDTPATPLDRHQPLAQSVYIVFYLFWVLCDGYWVCD